MVYAAIAGTELQSRLYAPVLFRLLMWLGTFDFILGDRKAVFDHCEIHSTPHGGYYRAVQALRKQDSGFVFDHCRLTADPGVTGPIFRRARGVPMPPSFICIPRWTTRSIPRWRRMASRRKPILETVYYAESHLTGRRAITTSAIRTPISSCPTRPSNRSGHLFFRGTDNWIRRSSPLRPRSKIEL